MINAKLVLFGDSIGKGIVTEASERAVTSANAINPHKALLFKSSSANKSANSKKENT